MKIGDARVSRPNQKLYLQIDELETSGCEKIFMESASGKTKNRLKLF
jgi:DNA invertase Pin-like site-specific DNA recombinase